MAKRKRLKIGGDYEADFSLDNFDRAQQRDGVRITVKQLAEPAVSDLIDFGVVALAHYHLPRKDVRAAIARTKANKLELLMQMVAAISEALGVDEPLSDEEPNDRSVEESEPGEVNGRASTHEVSAT